MKNIFLLLGTTLIGILLTISTAKGATILFPQGGGTGIGTALVGNIGNCLKVSNNSPFTYSLGECGSGSSSLSTSTNPLMATYFVATSTSQPSNFFSGLDFYGAGGTTIAQKIVSQGLTLTTANANASNNVGSLILTAGSHLGSYPKQHGNIYVTGVGDYSSTVKGADVNIDAGASSAFNGSVNITLGRTNGTSGYGSINLGHTNKDTNVIKDLVIDSSTGYVGISTTSPYAKLSVAGTVVGNNFISTSTSIASTFPYASTTQISSTGNAYFATSGGNVGIGTTTPTEKLSINGLAATTTLRLNNSAGNANDAVAILFSAENFREDGKIEVQRDGSTTGGIMKFFTKVNGGASTERLRIDASGNVGIATTSPWRTLSVNGSSDLGNNALAGYFTATTTTASVFPYASTTVFSSSGSAYLATSGGNVGIGTNVLTEKLNVSGNVAASGYFVYNGNSFNEFRLVNDAGSGYFTFDGYGERLYFIPRGGVASASGITYRDSSENDKILFSFGAQTLATFNSNAAGYKIMELKGAASQTANFLDVSSSSGTGDIFTILSSFGSVGNVGIGTTSPSSKLTVNGSAYIAGDIYATSTVTLTGLTTSSGTPSSICQNATTKEITVNAALTCTVSDINQKNSIEILSRSGLEIIEKIKPVQFKYNDSDRLRWGFIAQELQAIDPKLGDGYVETMNGIEAHSIDIPAITAITIKAIKEQQEEIKLLRAEIELLKNK